MNLQTSQVCNTVASTRKFVFTLFTFFLLLIGISQMGWGQCPDVSNCTGNITLINVDALPDCPGGTTFDGKPGQNTSCTDGNGYNCWQYIMQRSPNSPTQQFSLNLGQGQSCNGELDASYVLSGGVCSQMSSGGSQTLVDFVFPLGETEITIFMCVNSAGWTSMCNVCKEPPPCTSLPQCNLGPINTDICDISECDGSTIPTPFTNPADVFTNTGTCSVMLQMTSSDVGETSCIDSNMDGMLTVTRTYTLSFFDVATNSYFPFQTCDQDINITIGSGFSATCDLNPALQTISGCGVSDLPTPYTNPADVFSSIVVCGTPILIHQDIVSGTCPISVTRVYTLFDDRNGNMMLDSGEESETCLENFEISPLAITWTAPSDANEDACDYADQVAVDAAFSAWIAAQSAAIAPGGGCDPQLSNGGGSAPALCTGGMTMVSWTITDLCETISTITANFNLTAPNAVTWTAPSDANEDACDYADQAAVDQAFTAWIAAQSAAIAPGGGCDPQLSNGGGSAPALCTGGMTTVTWTITDLCETISTITANFNLTAPSAVTWTAPSDANELSCSYADQAAVDAAFSAWTAAQSAAIAPGGGCTPQLSNGGGSAPALCAGGMTMVTWTITDLCETISTITANFNLTAPSGLTWTAPGDANENACDYADQVAVDAAFTAWIAAQSAAIAPGGGCDPQLSNGGGSAPALCTGGTTMVTWTITDLCETISTITANFNLTAPTAVTWTAPSDANEDACDYADQAAVDQAFTAWIAAQSAAIAPGGGCLHS